MLYQRNVFTFSHLVTLHSLRRTILPARWALIQHLEVHEECFHTSPIVCGRWLQIRCLPLWDSEYQAIKVLPALRGFTMALDVSWIQEPSVLVEMLEPLKDLHLKDGWELKLYHPEGISEFDVALKEAGFRCFVKQC